MKKTWALNSVLLRCPPGWQQFIADLESRMNYDCPEGFYEETLNSELEQYGAKIYTVRGNYFVDFHDERRYTIFIIKYGGYH